MDGVRQAVDRSVRPTLADEVAHRMCVWAENTGRPDVDVPTGRKHHGRFSVVLG
ncbi:hypothetical protein [Plantactinospora sp. BB1]|uniref:hypothetical protein n=1 Tax=Plantactinospora sp. BB1 TaxID=2071627 RepID=UPI00131F2D7A|nr:hypothetical protein [Plantactinospora sp. BB1]